ncbi:MAG: hypothetical protein HY815_09630 [Candidatus Riflebacteria bacterium]|nr:hypothetical protein [Candidatus Riflebacteria bacterium]
MMKANSRTPYTGLVALLTVVVALQITGCGTTSVVPVTPVAGPVSTPTGLTGTTGQTAAPTPLGTIPAPITGPTAPGGNPPVVALPPPAESAAQIQRIVQRFGMQSITGSGATPDNLTRLEEAYARYPAGSCRNLAVVFESGQETSSDGFSGFWDPLDASGQLTYYDEARSRNPIASGKITYYGQRPDLWILVHELSHHLTLYVDPNFGVNLCSTVGYTLKPGQSLNGQEQTANLGEWATSAVPANSYPREYATSNSIEHIAELITHNVTRGGQGSEWTDDLLPNFQFPPRASAAISARFGTSPS